jgi:hypothetical protein
VHAVVSEPLQVPPQVPVPVHAVLPPTGAPVTGEQVPAMPAWLQPAHWPVQAELQHTVSTQKPEPHCAPMVHVEPRPSRPVHTLLMQVEPPAQSPGPAQLCLHAVAPHTYGAHGVVTALMQLPAPSQLADAVCVPAAQLAGEHCEVGKVHAVVSVPLQLPAHTPVPPHAVRPPTGAPVTGEQVPTLPARLHAAHCSVHALLQHTPSTQKPLAH